MAIYARNDSAMPGLFWMEELLFAPAVLVALMLLFLIPFDVCPALLTPGAAAAALDEDEKTP